MSKRYILTGAPGAGKTTLINALAERGYPIITEAATALIEQRQQKEVAIPWLQNDFIDAITAIQLTDIEQAPSSLCFFDRSPFCTIALARFLSRTVPDKLEMMAEKLATEQYFNTKVFYIHLLDTIEKTAARTISFNEAKGFGELHRTVYQHYGFELIEIDKATKDIRTERILSFLE